MTRARQSFKALIRRNIRPLPPTRLEPIMFTRFGLGPAGPGHYTTTNCPGACSGFVAANSPDKSEACGVPLRHYEILRPSRMRGRSRGHSCACARTRAYSLYWCSSVVVMSYSLENKGNKSVFHHYKTATNPLQRQGGKSKPLKSLETNKIFGGNHG